MYQPKLDMSFVTGEHTAFQPGMEALEAYLVSCLPPDTGYGFFGRTSKTQVPVAFDGARVRTLIEEFATPLADHVRSVPSKALVSRY